MQRLQRTPAVLLLIAGLWSLGLALSAFVVHVPVRLGSHDLVQTASGAYGEVPAVPQTYFQKYGVAELVLLALGFLLVIVVALALRQRAARRQVGAGGFAWGTSVGCLLLGIVGSVTIAPYLLLVGILLVVACGTFSRPDPAPEHGTSGTVPSVTGSTL